MAEGRGGGRARRGGGRRGAANTGAAAAIQGPTSALSSFLRERGIATRGRLSWRARLQQADDGAAAAAAGDNVEEDGGTAGEGGTSNTATEGATADQQDGAPSDTANANDVASEAPSFTVARREAAVAGASKVKASTSKMKYSQKGKKPAASKKRKAPPPKKKRRAGDTDSDASDFDDDGGDSDNSDTSGHGGPSRAPVWSARRPNNRNDGGGDGGEKCQRCGDPLTFLQQALCARCVKLSTLAAAKKKPAPKSRAAGKGNKQLMARPEDVYLTDGPGRRCLVPSLHDLCIRFITRHISDVEGFGAVSEGTREKLSLILSKHREINGDTLKLFLDDGCSTLHLFDCADITNEEYEQIAYFGGQGLVSMKLHQCGQLRDSSLNMMSDRLTSLRTLALCGCFLVTDAALATMVRALPHLETLCIEHSPKLGKAVAQSLSHSTTIRSLALMSCAVLNDQHIATISPLLCQLEQLEISSCPMVTDLHALVAHAATDHLTSLRINECYKAGNLESVLPLLPQSLTELSLVGASGVDLSVVAARCPALSHLDVSRTADPVSSVESLASLHELRHLNLNGQKELTVRALETVLQSVHRLEWVDVSWVLQFDDALMNLLLLGNTELQQLRVWGCHKITNFNRLVWERDRPALQLIGTFGA